MSETALTESEILTKLREARSTKTFSLFLETYGEQLKTVPFGEYLNRLCEDKGVSKAEIIKKASIERMYGYQFLNDTRRPPRDKALQFALALNLDVDETNELLQVAQKPPLNAKTKRDQAIIFALCHGYDVAKTQKLLLGANEPILGESRHD